MEPNLPLQDDWDHRRRPAIARNAVVDSRWTAAAILLGSLIIAWSIHSAAGMLAHQQQPFGNPLWAPPPVRVAGGPGPVPATGIWVKQDTPLQVGSKLLVPEGGQWWRGEVLAVNNDGTVNVHYVGWGPQFDRSFRRDQLQLEQ